MKSIAGFLFSCLICAFVMASPVSITLTDTTLEAGAGGSTSDATNIADISNATFFVTYDETEVGGGVSMTFTIEVSSDGTDWVTASFFDFGGGPGTFVTSEAISADGNYVAWLENKNMNYPYVRTKSVGTGVDVDDTVDVTVILTGTK